MLHERAQRRVRERVTQAYEVRLPAIERRIRTPELEGGLRVAPRRRLATCHASGTPRACRLGLGEELLDQPTLRGGVHVRAHELGGGIQRQVRDLRPQL